MQLHWPRGTAGSTWSYGWPFTYPWFISGSRFSQIHIWAVVLSSSVESQLVPHVWLYKSNNFQRWRRTTCPRSSLKLASRKRLVLRIRCRCASFRQFCCHPATSSSRIRVSVSGFGERGGIEMTSPSITTCTWWGIESKFASGKPVGVVLVIVRLMLNIGLEFIFYSVWWYFAIVWKFVPLF